MKWLALILILMLSLASATCRADSDFEMGLPGHIIRIAVQSESRVPGLKLPSNGEVAELAKRLLAEELTDPDPTKRRSRPDLTVEATSATSLEMVDGVVISLIVRIEAVPVTRAESANDDNARSLAIVSLSETIGNVRGSLSFMEGWALNTAPPSSFVSPVDQPVVRQMLEGAIRERLDAVSRLLRVKS